MLPLFQVVYTLGTDNGYGRPKGHKDVGMIDRMSFSVTGVEMDKLANTNLLSPLLSEINV